MDFDKLSSHVKDFADVTWTLAYEVTSVKSLDVAFGHQARIVPAKAAEKSRSDEFELTWLDL